jgi:hypothetical protein
MYSVTRPGRSLSLSGSSPRGSQVIFVSSRLGLSHHFGHVRRSKVCGTHGNRKGGSSLCLLHMHVQGAGGGGGRWAMLCAGGAGGGTSKEVLEVVRLVVAHSNFFRLPGHELWPGQSRRDGAATFEYAEAVFESGRRRVMCSYRPGHRWILAGRSQAGSCYNPPLAKAVHFRKGRFATSDEAAAMQQQYSRSSVATAQQ